MEFFSIEYAYLGRSAGTPKAVRMGYVTPPAHRSGPDDAWVPFNTPDAVIAGLGRSPAPRAVVEYTLGGGVPGWIETIKAAGLHDPNSPPGFTRFPAWAHRILDGIGELTADEVRDAIRRAGACNEFQAAVRAALALGGIPAVRGLLKSTGSSG